MRAKGDSWAIRSGVLLGLIAAAVFLLAFPVKGGGGAMGLDVSITSMRTGEFDVKPMGPFLRGAGLGPGDDGAEGSLEVLNKTGSKIPVGINVLPSTSYSDRILEVTATYEGRVVMKGLLGDLRGMHEGLFDLDSGEIGVLEVTARVVAGATDYQGRVEDVVFELHMGIAK